MRRVAVALAWAAMAVGQSAASEGQQAGKEAEATATTSAASPCAQEKHREFDFWVGDWDVKDANGHAAGRNVITSEENGCVIVEHWRGAKGGSGQSLNYYDPAAMRWKQVWAGLGLLLHMDGEFSDGRMRLEGPLQYLGTNRRTILRGTWTPLPEGGLRHQFEESTDGGKTWTPWFDGQYTRH